MITTSKRRRQRSQKLSAAHGCTRRHYPDEETARRCLWAMGQQGRINVDRLTVVRCRACGKWHVRRIKT
jgi:hypothetical protein